ncbi:MAG TPA: hypothetical protein VKI62_04990 [Bacteroidota bacterium]|nr:hypothetical protein [Bacteroidota bacterium]
MIKHASILFIVIVGMILLHGCSLTNFPLILSSSVEETIRVDTPPVQFANSVFVNLADVRNVANIDSAKFYNLTLLIDSNTTPNTKISGSVTVDGNTIVSLDSIATSQFSSERSIFDTSIVGLHFQPAGIAYVVNALGEQNPPTVTITATLNQLSDSVHCSIHVRIYGQLFTKN